MKKCTFMVLIFLAVTLLGHAQVPTQKSIKTGDSVSQTGINAKRWFDAAFGIGLDYGGLPGVKITVNPASRLGLFIAFGNEMVGMGWNVGALCRILPAYGKHKVRPYVKAMYGVNAAIKVDGLEGYDHVYEGVTIGAGSEFRFGKKKNLGFNVDLGYPFRSKEYQDAFDALVNNPAIIKITKPADVSLSIGFHIEF